MSDDARHDAERVVHQWEQHDRHRCADGLGEPVEVRVARAYLVVADRDRLAGEVERLRAALRPCLAILRYKEIRPPMNPGTQERLEREIAAALATRKDGE
jgi:hypothetical protein